MSRRGPSAAVARTAAVAVAIVLMAALALAGVVLPAGCTRRDPGAAGTLRLGHFPNVTHAQALVGVADGTFARAVGGPIEVKVFHAGPAAMEALLAGELDAAYVGPGPAAVAFLRTRGAGLRVVAGAASGGAALVVRSARKPEDLLGKRVATPQLGNTQDVALRTWLRAKGYGTAGGERGVSVTPLANPDILSLFARGDVDGAWVPEPWAARLVAEAGGRILVDERDLWPGGAFPSAVLVVATRALATRRPALVALLRAHLELTDRWARDPAAFTQAANDAYGKLAGKPLPPAVLADAFSRVAPLADPLPAALSRLARDARALGFAPDGDPSRMVDASLLAEARSPGPGAPPARP